MIEKDRLHNLSEDALSQLSELELDCEGLRCWECPFELSKGWYNPKTGSTYRCAFAYAKELYRRLNE